MLAANPVPYHIAFYRALARHPSVNLTVFYCSRHGLSGGRDVEFDIPLIWDDPARLLEGYRHRFLRNVSPWGSGSPWGLINPGVLGVIPAGHYDALLLPGYGCASYLMGFLAAWMSGTPVLLRGETLLRAKNPKERAGSAKKFLVRFLLRRTRACLAIGRSSRLFYEFHGVPRHRIFFSPYCADNDFFRKETQLWKTRRDDQRREMEIPSGRPVILFCGKLIPRKRPGDLLEAFLRLERPAALVFAGDGPLRSELRRKAAGRSDVLFVGFQRQTELARCYALADLFVLPSAHEPWGMVVNEALACGLPAILSDGVLAGLDLVLPGENGLIFPAGDIRMLAASLDRLLSDEALRERMGQVSLQIAQRWSPEAAASGVAEALKTCR